MNDITEIPLTTAQHALHEELYASCWWADDVKRGEINSALRRPASMPLWIFQSIRNRLLDMLVLQHRGQGNSPGFAERLQLLDQLVSSAPWVVDPDIGVLPKNLAVVVQPRPPATAAPTAAAPSDEKGLYPWPATVMRKISKALK